MFILWSFLLPRECFLQYPKCFLALFVSSEPPGLLTWEGTSKLPGLPGCAINPLYVSAEIFFF